MKVQTVKGKALKLWGRELTPLVQVTSYAKGGRTRDGAFGGGGGFVRLRPLAILETGPTGTRRIPVRDVTSAAVKYMACLSLLSFLVWVGAEIFIRLKGGGTNGAG